MSRLHKQKRRFLFGVLLFSAFFAIAIPTVVVFADEDDDESSEETELTEEEKEELEELEDEKDDLEDDIEKEQKQLNQQKQQLSSIQRTLSATQQQVNQTTAFIAETEEKIERTVAEITTLQGKILFQERVMRSLLRELFFSRRENTVAAIFVGNDSLSDVMDGTDHASALKDKTQTLLSDVKTLREDQEKKKQELEGVRQEHEGLLSIKKAQEEELSVQRNSQATVVANQEATVAELNAKLSKLESQLGALLGESYDTDDIVEAARFASSKTGVRKDFILGMLVVESDLGRYTGGCTYKESRMSGRRAEIFKNIAKELDKDYKKLKVSCPPANYTGTGGAMGVAQFMPDTWIGYKSRIASKTGHNPPDPWNLTDGVMAMALKHSGVSGVTSHNRSGECNAAKLYLSGTTSSKYDWYCEKVLYWADNYEKKL